MAPEKRLADVNSLLAEIDRTIEIMEKRREHFSLRNLIMCIRKAPTVEAVEVVRCAKCHWLVTQGYEEENAHITEPHLKSGFCGIWGKDTQMCNFCSYGERREGE